MKKIIILTSDNAFQKYFVNELSSNFIISGVFIIGDGSFVNRIKSLKSRYKSNLIFALFKRYYNKSLNKKIQELLYPESDNEKLIIYNKLFDSKWKCFQNEDNIFYNKRFQFDDWYDEIYKISPDVIIVHGGGWISKKIINLAKDYTINLHWGHSPFYRGSNCTAFAFYNSDKKSVGVTIHELSNKIDGGDIYDVGFPELSDHDSVFSAEMKLTVLGSSIIIKLMKGYFLDGIIKSKPQDLSKGKLYLVKHMSIKIAKIINDKFINN